MVKKCNHCGEQKPLEAFYSHPRGKHGRNSRCTDCILAIKKQHRQENGDEIRRKQRDYHFKRSYGISREEWLAHSKCQLCGRSGRVHTDHDHVTGALRGFLCSNCNTALGLLGDNPELMRRAANYIETCTNPSLAV